MRIVPGPALVRFAASRMGLSIHVRKGQPIDVNMVVTAGDAEVEVTLTRPTDRATDRDAPATSYPTRSVLPGLPNVDVGRLTLFAGMSRSELLEALADYGPRCSLLVPPVAQDATKRPRFTPEPRPKCSRSRLHLFSGS